MSENKLADRLVEWAQNNGGQMSDDLELAEHTIDTAIALIDRLQKENDQLRADNERLNHALGSLPWELKIKSTAFLSERLVEWAQNNEMIDKWYTDHGKDCLEAAKLIESFQNFTRLNRSE